MTIQVKPKQSQFMRQFREILSPMLAIGSDLYRNMDSGTHIQIHGGLANIFENASILSSCAPA